MTTITWLHLSDLHLRGDEGAVDRAVFDNMLQDIETQTKSLMLDALFFTGDLTFSGQRHQYQQAIAHLDRVLAACGLPKRRDRLFLVPGNHDLDRSAVKESHIAVTRKLLSNKKEPGESNAYDRVNRFLSDHDERVWFLKKFDHFRAFIQEFYGDHHDAATEGAYYSVRALEKGAYVVPVFELNSAWLSHTDDEQGRLLLGEQQVCDACEVAKSKWPNARLRIALVHHPLYWMAEKDIHRIQGRLPNVCDLLLRGHLHCPSYFSQQTPDWHTHEFAAGASWKASWHAYGLATLDLEDGTLTPQFRFQHPELSSNWGPDHYTYRNMQQGHLKLRVRLRG